MNSNNIDVDVDDICGICHDNHINKIKLKCNHIYCFSCIKDWYIVLEKEKHLYNYKSRECPYCNKQGDFLQLDINEIPIKNIHSEYISSKHNNRNKCNGLTKLGNQCNNFEQINGFCYLHM